MDANIDKLQKVDTGHYGYSKQIIQLYHPRFSLSSLASGLNRQQIIFKLASITYKALFSNSLYNLGSIFQDFISGRAVCSATHVLPCELRIRTVTGARALGTAALNSGMTNLTPRYNPATQFLEKLRRHSLSVTLLPPDLSVHSCDPPLNVYRASNSDLINLYCNIDTRNSIESIPIVWI